MRQGGHQTYLCQNVMPEMNTLNVDPAREMIREVFVKHIVEAKGLERAVDYVGNLVMPTPMAVLRITELLASGTETEPGIGDTMVVRRGRRDHRRPYRGQRPAGGGGGQDDGP